MENYKITKEDMLESIEKVRSGDIILNINKSRPTNDYPTIKIFKINFKKGTVDEL